MKIDTSQINAIRHKDGPELVLAGPGSGKTLVITRRVQHLIDQYHVPPSAILVITFTKAAATEMRQRFEKLMGGRRVPVSFGTFHSIDTSDASFGPGKLLSAPFRSGNCLPQQPSGNNGYCCVQGLFLLNKQIHSCGYPPSLIWNDI